MDTIFTYSYLETLAGGVAATILIAGFIENIAFFKKVPAYLIYYIIAETLIVLPHLVNADFQLKEIPLYGLLIAATAQKTSKMKSLDGKNGGLKP
jgi:hypothetical protein